MKNLNEKDKDKDKEKDKEMNEKERVKTFLHINKNTLRQIPYEYKTKKIHKIKQKNLIISYEILSMPGTERGKQKINQDTYFILPNINNTHNAKIFGIFDGHGINGDKLSQEIRDYFIEFFSDKSKYEKEKLIDNNQRLSTDENLEKIDKYITKNNFREINQIFKQINSKIHEKYQQNNFCMRASVPALVMLSLFVIRFLLEHIQQRNFGILTCLMLWLVILGATTPLMEFYRGWHYVAEAGKINIVQDQIRTLDKAYVRMPVFGWSANHQFTAKNYKHDIFWNYLAKK
jgi:hypothetical protein